MIPLRHRLEGMNNKFSYRKTNMMEHLLPLYVHSHFRFSFALLPRPTMVLCFGLVKILIQNSQINHQHE